MNLQIIIATIFIILLLIDFRKWYTVLIVINVALNLDLNIKGLNLFTLIGLISVPIFLLKNRIRFTYLKKYPFYKPSLLIIFSMVLTTFYAQEKHIPSVVSNIIITLFMPFIFWILLVKSPKKVLDIFIKTSIIYSLIICLYTFFELITRSNPYIEILDTWNLRDNVTFVEEIRYGFKRCQSIFNMHTTLGGVCIPLLAIFLYIRLCVNYPIKKNLLNTIILMLTLSILFTGARSAIIGCFIVLFMIFKKEFFTPKNVLLGILTASIIIVINFTYISEVISSIIFSDTVSGSSSDMRLIQYTIALKFMMQNIIWGNGFDYTGEYVLKYYKDEIYGAESMWLPLMINHGIIGVLSYLFLFYSIYKYIKRTENNKVIYFLVGYYIFNSLSSIPDCYITFIIIYILVMCKIKEYAKLEIPNKNLSNIM